MTNFAATRLAAALAVVVGHAFVLTGGVAPMVLGTPVHVLAVRVFFAISGYLVCSSWQRDPCWGRFLMRRGLRILPGLWAVVAVAVLVVGPLVSTLGVRAYFASPVTADYWWNMVLSPRFALPGVFEDGRGFTAVNGSLWSLPVEVAMYLLLPVYAGVRWLGLAVVLAGVVGAVAFTAVWPDQVQPVFYGTSLPFSLRFASDFFAGALVRSWGLERWLRVQVALVAVVVAQCCTGSGVALAVVSAGVVPYAVLAFCLAGRPVFGWMDRRADLSYGVYLWGVPVQQVVLTLFGTGIAWWGVSAVAVPAVLAAAWGSWVLVERPALRWKPRGLVPA